MGDVVRDHEGAEIAVGDVVQLDPDRHGGPTWFGGCLMVVTELKPAWDGLQGYVAAPGEKGLAYYRTKGAETVRIGVAAWVASND